MPPPHSRFLFPLLACLPPYARLLGLPLNQKVRLAFFLCFFLGLVLPLPAAYGRAYEVEVNGQTLGYVAHPGVLRQARSVVLEDLRARFGQEVRLADNVCLVPARVSEHELLGTGALAVALERNCRWEALATGIVVNGRTAALVRDTATAERVLARLKAQYAPAGEATVRFVEDVALVRMTAPPEAIWDEERALQQLRYGGEGPARHVVGPGDTVWDIAGRYGVAVEDLLASNQGLDPGRMQLGTTLLVPVGTPLVNVVAFRRETVLQRLEFSTEVRQDANLYQGQRRVVREGRPGWEEVTYEVVTYNGREQNRQVVARRLLEPPVGRVVAEGTRSWLVASRGDGGGRLAWPTPGGVSSPYGRRGGRMHTGIDISGPLGNPVVAAEAGRVVMAGWYAGYGKTVDIAHGGGAVTRYAHLSAILVSVGQYVERGQLIGRLGAT
ncbi:MAG: M23 family metallopeptidase, partial [Firmicutes bacterium]|nr:M23 family metallopeptidase [Bacillota bacterium]